MRTDSTQQRESAVTLKGMMVVLLGTASLTLVSSFTAPSAHAFTDGGLMSGLGQMIIHQPALAEGDDLAKHPLLHASAGDIGAGAENFIDGMAKRALEFLSNPALSREQKQASFKKLLQDSFDLDTIGRFTLGRYWRTANDAQKKEYQQLFRAMVVDVYTKRFDEYKGQRFETRGNRVDGEKDVIVTSFIVPDEGPEVQVDWRVRYKNGRYQIVDVIVEGVSMSVTQRSDFAAVIQRGGGDVQVLLAYLKNPG